MSKNNKVNKNNYDQGGRLTPDEMARHRMNQTRLTVGRRRKEHAVGRTIDRAGERASTRPRNEREE